jgi:hypothetical protein
MTMSYLLQVLQEIVVFGAEEGEVLLASVEIVEVLASHVTAVVALNDGSLCAEVPLVEVARP